jgi:hypothetical protein
VSQRPDQSDPLAVDRLLRPLEENDEGGGVAEVFPRQIFGLRRGGAGNCEREWIEAVFDPEPDHTEDRAAEKDRGETRERSAFPHRADSSIEPQSRPRTGPSRYAFVPN